MVVGLGILRLPRERRCVVKLTQAQRNARDKHLEALRDTRDALEAARDEYVADVENALEALEAARAEGSADEAEDARLCATAAETFNAARRAAWEARIAPALVKFNDAIEAASTFITETAEALRAIYDAPATLWLVYLPLLKAEIARLQKGGT